MRPLSGLKPTKRLWFIPQIFLIYDLLVIDQIGLGCNFQSNNNKDQDDIHLRFQIPLYIYICKGVSKKLIDDLGEKDGKEIKVGV